MILRAIRVEGWRCFAARVDVRPFSETLNVLHAPNATGKSTLFEAVTRGLLDDHKVSGKDADALRPWGRALAPSVAVEFAHGGVEYRLSKRFLDEPFAKLERLEGGRFVALAERDAAVQRVRELLSTSPPGRGLSQLKNWGIAQVLWAAQRGLALGELTGDVVAQIQTRLGGNGAPIERESGPIEQRLAARFGEIYTARGELKKGKEAPPVARLRAELESLRASEKQALEDQSRFEEAVRGLEDLEAHRAQAARDANELHATHQKAQADAAEQRALLEKKKEVEARVALARKDFEGVRKLIDDLKSLRASLKDGRERLARMDSDAPLRERELDSRKQEASRLERALEEVRQELKKIGEAKKTADLASRFLDAREKLEAAEKRVREVRIAGESLTSRKKARSELLAPDAKLMQAIRNAFKQRDDAQVRLDSALITLEIVPEQRGTLHVISGEEVGDRDLAPGTPVTVKGSPRVVVEVPGFGRIGASGPVGSSQELREKRDEAARKLADLTRGFGASELEALESLHEKAKRLEDSAAKAETQLATLLAGERVEGLEQRRALLASSLKEILERQPGWSEAPPDAASLSAAAAAKESALVAEVQIVETRWQAAYKALADEKERQGTIAAAAGAARGQLESLESARAELESDGKSDMERAADLTGLAMKASSADGELDAVRKKLESFSGDALDLAARLERQLREAEKASADALSRELKADGRIGELAMRGTYSVLATIQEERAALEAKLAQEELRANAIRLLWDTVRACRDEARAAIAGPIEKAATRILERVSGRRLGRLELSGAFAPAHVIPEAAGEPIMLDRISGGEEEQAYLAARLALAEVLAKEERQLVVLDDVLGATDSARQARILRVLEEASQRLQILVITCHPERYRGLEGASFFDLEGIVRAGVGE